MVSEFKKTSFLFGGNTIFVEEIYEQYLKEPSSVDSSWQEFFKVYQDQAGDMMPSWGGFPKVVGAISSEDKPNKPQASNNTDVLSLRAELMINAYRQYGHYLAKLDPLAMESSKTKKDLELEFSNFGIVEEDLFKMVLIKGKSLKLSELLTMLDAVYSKSISIECNHLQNSSEIAWLYEKFEAQNTVKLTPKEKISILENLIAAGGMENYLHVKFPGAKRFSIEGGDATIAALEYVIESFAKTGVKEAVLGMAHRGRLATLTRVMGKPYRALFAEFMGKYPFLPEAGVAGDVKYHMGYNSEKKFDAGSVKMSLLPNPSHLEAVNPLVAGAVRAKQDLLNNKDRNEVAGILIHGDAAFCGQGVVAESLAMSGISPYSVGGILHFVINNQVGFTANAKDTRTSRYSTEMAKMSGNPIFHVNGDDAESVIFATNLALEYKQKFGKDAVVEIICYRKYGHNEGDEPMYTQPQMYEIIKKKPTPADVYAAKLEKEGVLSAVDYKVMQDKFKAYLDDEFAHASEYKSVNHKFEGLWSRFGRNGKEVETGVESKTLSKLGTALCTIPSDFTLNPKLKKLFDSRIDDLKTGGLLDWAAVEQLAYASLLMEGTSIRITGQDAGRGTFSHRHSVLHDQVNGLEYLPLNNLPTVAKGKSGTYEVADSNLSEYGVLGFEYGYSLINPDALVIWEAQFGDFANGAQIIFDQFISSSESKWMQMSGLVVLLPHGYEGQGPEHSSARLERFLQLCAEDNMQVVCPSTPTSFFHLIRRQIHRNFRKPLIVMSPKSLLRRNLTSMSELSSGTRFTPVIDDNGYDKATRLVLSCGKIYHDLFDARSKQDIKNVALVRIEELYPFPDSEFKKIFAKYKSIKEVVWCQEEAENIGAWRFIKPYLENSIGNVKLSYAGRKAAASPAVGYLSVHNIEQSKVVEEALKG